MRSRVVRPSMSITFLTVVLGWWWFCCFFGVRKVFVRGSFASEMREETKLAESVKREVSLRILCKLRLDSMCVERV